MTKHPLLEQLIDAHLDFLDQHFAQRSVIEQEFVNFYQWLCDQPLKQLWSFEHIHQLLQQQILNTPISPQLLAHFAEHIRFALIHPLNEHTTIADVIPVLTVDKTAQYVASKSTHRKKLIHQVVNHPAFAAMLSELIQQTIQDYLDHSMITQVPGMSRFMKLGKSVLENVTDSNLDDTIAKYLQKNILKIIQMSENVLNEHFDDEKLYQFQARLWHKVKQKPLSVFKNYIEVNDLPNTIELIHEVWEHARHTDYLQQQLHDGLYVWYSHHQEDHFDVLLRQLNIDQHLVTQQLSHLLEPLVQHCIQTGYLRQRSREVLSQFYYSAPAKGLLNLD